jgi:hypothetical protein
MPDKEISCRLARVSPPPAGKISVSRPRTSPISATSRSPTSGGGGLRRSSATPPSAQPDRAREPGRRHQRHCRLGLGAIGALAAKPAEGKAVLFEVAGIDCFDIEIDARPDKLVEIIAALD